MTQKENHPLILLFFEHKIKCITSIIEYKAYNILHEYEPHTEITFIYLRGKKQVAKFMTFSGYIKKDIKSMADFIDVPCIQ
jgi:hypothetical protein